MKRYVRSSELDLVKEDLEELIRAIDELHEASIQIYRSLPQADKSAGLPEYELGAISQVGRYLAQARNLATALKDFGYTDKFEKIRKEYD